MTLHECFLRLQSFLPPVRKRLHTLLQIFFPLLQSTFQENTYAQLLALFCLDRAAQHDIRGARKLLDRLEPVCQAGSDAEKALWHVLDGICFMQADNDEAMTAAFDDAASFGHSFHMPYMLSGQYHLLTSQQYDRALERLDQGINCIYQYPPLDDNKRYVMALAHASMALCLTMMHRYDEAQDTLRKAEHASDSQEYLHASAMLSAVRKDADAAAKALASLKELNPELHNRAAAHVRMILDGTHIHFYARPVDPQLVADFWVWFQSQEPVFQPLLEKGDADSCGDLLAAHIDTLVPDPEDMMTATVELRDGKPEMILTACYSRSYAAMIDAFAAACPADIRQRWIITLRP